MRSGRAQSPSPDSLYLGQHRPGGSPATAQQLRNRSRLDIEWRQGSATRAPLPDDAFDVVACQAALMFVPDPARAIHEMARVITPRGHGRRACVGAAFREARLRSVHRGRRTTRRHATHLRYRVFHDA